MMFLHVENETISKRVIISLPHGADSLRCSGWRHGWPLLTGGPECAYWQPGWRCIKALQPVPEVEWRNQCAL